MNNKRKRTDYKNTFRVISQIGGIWVLDPLDPYYLLAVREYRNKKDKEISEIILSNMKKIRARQTVLIFTTLHQPNFIKFIDIPLPEEFKAELKAWDKNVVFTPEELMGYILTKKAKGDDKNG